MATTNSTIIGDFLLAGTNDYQQRVPAPAQAGMAATAKALFDPMNRDIWNSFYDFLINRVGSMYVRNQTWDNGLEQYIKPLEYGTTVEETQVGWVKAHTFMDPDDSLLRSHYVKGGSAFHSINYENYYPVTVSEVALRRAVTSEYGLNQLIASIMTAPVNSDKYDVYRSMMQLFATYEANHPMYRVGYSAAPSTEEDFRNLLTDLIAWSQKLRFPSAAYNATGDAEGMEPIAVFAQPSDLTLFVTPEIYAGIGVKGLGMLFNVEEGRIPYKVTVVDEFPFTGVFAILTTEDFFQCYRTLYETTSFFNGRKMERNTYLHDQMVMSASPFAPVIAFGTGTATSLTTVTQSVTSVQITPSTTTAKPGDTVQLTVALQGSIAPAGTPGVEVAPDACTWTVTAETAASDGEPIPLNSRTYVDRNGVLHIQKSDLETGNVLTVQGVTTYVNPSGPGTASTYNGKCVVTIK